MAAMFHLHNSWDGVKIKEDNEKDECPIFKDLFPEDIITEKDENEYFGEYKNNYGDSKFDIENVFFSFHDNDGKNLNFHIVPFFKKGKLETSEENRKYTHVLVERVLKDEDYGKSVTEYKEKAYGLFNVIKERLSGIKCTFGSSYASGHVWFSYIENRFEYCILLNRLWWDGERETINGIFGDIQFYRINNEYQQINITGNNERRIMYPRSADDGCFRYHPKSGHCVYNPPLRICKDDDIETKAEEIAVEFESFITSFDEINTEGKSGIIDGNNWPYEVGKKGNDHA